MSKIILVRHAKVLARENQKIYASEVAGWVEHYNEAPIDTSLPECTVIQRLEHADIVMASSLPRTHASLGVVGIEPARHDALFDEAEVPLGNIPYLKLYPRQWLVVLRLMMFLGLGKGSSSLKASKSRAIKAAEYLMQLSQTHESIALMGHGGMNWLIGRALREAGWVCVEDKHGSRNWGVKVYEKNR